MKEENTKSTSEIKTRFWRLTPSDSDTVSSLLVSNFFLNSLGPDGLNITPKQTMFILQLLDNARWVTVDDELRLQTNIGYEKLHGRLKVSKSALQKRAHALSYGRTDSDKPQPSLLSRETRRITSSREYKTKVHFDLVPLMVEMLRLRGLQSVDNLHRRGNIKWPKEVVGSEGCTPIAQDFLLRYRSLGISDTEALILVQRIRYFSLINNPEPAIRNRDLAKKVNIKVRQVQKLQQKLHEKGLIILRDEGKKGYPVKTNLLPLLEKLWPEKFEK